MTYAQHHVMLTVALHDGTAVELQVRSLGRSVSAGIERYQPRYFPNSVCPPGVIGGLRSSRRRTGFTANPRIA
jgi:hypothetical protein